MRRRLQAKAAVFTRLEREGLASVLDKKIKPHYPLAARNGTSKKKLRQQLIDEVVADLFSPQNDNEGLVEVTLRDGEKIVKHHRSFLTGSLVESALTAAIDELVFLAEESPSDEIGLDSARLTAALREQIESLAAVMTNFNAGDYVDLPDNSHVASVRRLRANGRPASSLVVYRE